MTKGRTAHVTYDYSTNLSSDAHIVFRASLEFDDTARDCEGMSILGLEEAERLHAALGDKISEVKRLEKARRGSD